MTFITNIKTRHIVIVFLSIAISIIFGVFANDVLIGGTILLTGILCSYFASEGMRSNYFFGLINAILMGYVSFKNNLYGTFFFYIFISTFLEIVGFFMWKNNISDNKNVNVREFSLKGSFLIVGLCIMGSFLLGDLLALIPSQRLAFMDASSNCINICGCILINLRFKECWWIWLANNIIDLEIWIMLVINNGPGSIMMLLVSIAYLLINIYGVIKWQLQINKKNNRAI